MVKRSREDSSPPSSPSTPTSILSTVPGSGTASPHSVETSAHSSKYLQVTSERSRPPTVMKCSLPPHHETLTFSTFEEFEIHYSKAHANRCADCRRNFPTEHFLGLHIGENHDPLNEARRAKGEKTYRCFVEGCDKVCLTAQKRRMHLIDKHTFPKNYDFLIVNTGVDKRSSMLRSRHRRPSSAASRALARDHQTSHNPTSPAETSQHVLSPTSESSQQEQPFTSSRAPEMDIDDLTSTMSALKFVPPSVRFGRRGRRGGLSKS